MILASALIEKFVSSLNDKWGYIWGKTHEMWSDAKQAAYVKAYKDNTKRAMSVRYGGKWAGHWVTDCSGLFTYWFEQLGGKMYHGSNTMYRDYCTAKGTLIAKTGKRSDGQPLKPGTAVFTGTEGSHGHVGLYIGGGYVIEAKGAKDGVVKTPVTDKRWTFWGELKGVQYDGIEPAPTPDPTPTPSTDKPTLRRGSKGEYVKELQKDLQKLGYDLGSYGVDGDFGRATEAAVKAFQMDRGLKVDGICGPATWAALDNPSPEPTPEPVATLYTVHIPYLTEDRANGLIAQYPGSWKTTE